MTDARQFYGRWARLYDALARLPGVRSWRAAAVDELGLSPGDVVVEMGCGTGANLPHARRAVGPEGRVVGLDVTRAMLDRARGRGDADLILADAARPPLAGPVDGLLATFVAGMFADPAAAVDGWCDLVRPGGRVALLHFAPSDRTWARPLNAAYRGFVWLSSTEKRRPSSVATGHRRRVDTAHDRLRERADDYRERRLAGGYLRLASGRVNYSSVR
ncbi:class I SAM-dependent methyltransferase [Halomicrobium salinisoli]|uniref:class I SAM-dependent methyltransferase n=1 Tax=Halomicrobium salinisoli TaxID=2878391 RepID=UPI001CF00FBB|nr:methyltransferase domain-containing protein [Halomicrobium salinisoli]